MRISTGNLGKGESITQTPTNLVTDVNALTTRWKSQQTDRTCGKRWVYRHSPVDCAGSGGGPNQAAHDACFRHTYRTWLNATGTPIATQQKLMRHSTITMAMDTYGTVFDEEMNAASSRVARLAFQDDRAQSR